MINYLVKSYVNQHGIDVFGYIYGFPISITYLWKVLSKTFIEEEGKETGALFKQKLQQCCLEREETSFGMYYECNSMWWAAGGRNR